MSDRASLAHALLDAWGAQHAHRPDSVRFHSIDALERRAAGHGGEVRWMPDERFHRLVEDYAGDLARVAFDSGSGEGGRSQAVHDREPLGVLVDQLASRAAACNDAPSHQVALAAPEALDELRRIGFQVRSHSQLRQPLDEGYQYAAPLDSASWPSLDCTDARAVAGTREQFLRMSTTSRGTHG